MKTILTCAAALSMAAWAGAAMARSFSYTGTYKVALTNDVFVNSTGYHRHGPDSTHCLALTDDGSAGWKHSGYVLVDSQYYGQFQVIGRSILIFVDMIGSGEEPATWAFTSIASKGDIDTNGGFDYVQGGTSYNSADATFGTRGTC